MISIACVADDRKVLGTNLLASLRKQNVDFELLVVDNTKGQFASIPEALNNVASRARHDYIMFVHQDVYLIGESWLKQAEEICNGLSSMGLAGVAGVNEKGEHIGFIVDRGRLWGAPLNVPTAAFTLDECLLLLPKSVFFRNRLDENFRFHSYGADICLRIHKQGLRVYVIPCPIYHNSATLPILRAGNIEKDDLRLYLKHHRAFPAIHKTTGKAFPKYKPSKIRRSTKLLSYQLSNMFHANERIFADFTTESLLLDFGVIPKEQLWIKSVKRGSYSIGVSIRRQYLLVSKKLNIHDDYVRASPSNLPFRKQVFDVIIIKGLLEYLKKAEGWKALSNALQIVRKELVIFAPNKSYPLDYAYQYYLSSWNPEELQKLGFKMYGSHFRVDIQRKVKILKIMPFLKPILTKMLPSSMASELLYIKTVA